MAALYGTLGSVPPKAGSPKGEDTRHWPSNWFDDDEKNGSDSLQFCLY